MGPFNFDPTTTYACILNCNNDMILFLLYLGWALKEGKDFRHQNVDARSIKIYARPYCAVFELGGWSALHPNPSAREHITTPLKSKKVFHYTRVFKVLRGKVGLRRMCSNMIGGLTKNSLPVV